LQNISDWWICNW